MLFSLLFTVALIIGLLFLLSIGIEVVFFLVILGIAGMFLFSFGGAFTVLLYLMIKVLIIVLVASIVIGVFKSIMNILSANNS